MRKARLLASRVGLDTVQWVRVVAAPGGTRCEAHGTRRHRPVATPIPLALAARLVRDGVPVVTRSAVHR